MTTDDGWQLVRSHDGTGIAWRLDGPAQAGTASVLDPEDRALPPVVLSNGIACDDGYWRDVWPALAAHTPVLRWHYRGHGRSEDPHNPEEVILSSVVRDLLEVVEAAGIGRAVLVGHSYGVQVVCETFRSAPELVAGIVAVAGAAGHPLGTLRGRDPGTLLFPLLELAMWPAPRLVEEVLSAGFRSPLAYWVGRAIGGIGPEAPRDVMRRYFAHVADRDVPTMLRMFRAMQEHTAEDLLATIDVPTTVIAGTADGMTPLRHPRRMAETVPGAELVEVEGATHVLPVEFPDVVVEQTLALARAATAAPRLQEAEA
jgi:pimeloyl-ACP methyl ester carboxylesterase